MMSRHSQSEKTFFSVRWLKPETKQVKSFVQWTTALAMAVGALVMLRRQVRQITPPAMPSIPSMHWAMKPMSA